MIKGGMETNVLKFLSDDQIKMIHDASMRVLEKSGVLVDDKKALEFFSEKGLKVDFAKDRVYFTEENILKAIKEAPSTITLYGRNDDTKNMELGGTKVYTGTGGTAINVLDFDRVRRPSRVEDIAKTAKLVDALDNIHFFILPCYPNDVEEKDVDVNRFYHALNNTTKPIMGSVFTEEGFDKVLDMAAKIAGSKENLVKKPFISFISSISSPLKLEKKYINMLFRIAKEGIPVATSCAPIAGATAPVTLAGTLVQLNAEALAVVALIQTIKPGTPAFYSAVPTIMDMQTMSFLFGSTESGIMNAAAAQLAQHYKLPLYSTGGISDAKLPDEQAGYEKAITCILPALAGANFIHEAGGQLDSGMTISYAQYVIDNDINGSVLRTVRGIEIDATTLADEVINRVGPGGNFLGEKLTAKKMRTEFYYPKAAARVNYDGWERKGKKDTWTMAEEVAKKILSEHKPAPIPEKINEEILAKEPGIKKVEF